MTSLNLTNIFFDTPSHKRHFIDDHFKKEIGRTRAEILAKLATLIGHKNELEITNKHLLNCFNNIFTERTLTSATQKLVELDLLKKVRVWVRDEQGRILSSKNTYSINWKKVWEMITDTVWKKLQLPSAVPSSFSKEKENNVHKSTFRFFSTKVKEQPVASSLPKTRIELKKDKPISKSWCRKAWEVGIHTDQIEKIHPEFIKYHTETKPSRRTAKQWTLAWIRWIANNITYSKEEKMPKLKKEVIDPYKIESEMRYEIYNEKSETIKTLRFKILEFATPSTYKAWFKDIIFETCFNDDNYDYVFIPRSNFIKDKFDTDPKLNGILKAFKIKMAA